VNFIFDDGFLRIARIAGVLFVLDGELKDVYAAFLYYFLTE